MSIFELLLDDLSADWLTLHLSEAEFLLLRQFLEAELLLLVIVFEIVEQPCARLEVGKNLQHLLSNFWINLLAVASLASWLVLIVRVLNMNELGVWNILDVDPFDSDRTWPFPRLLPKVLMVDVVRNSTLHFGHTTEVLRLIHTEHEVN